MRVCVCRILWVCVALRAAGSDHSSSHKVTFSRQELCVLEGVCSPTKEVVERESELSSSGNYVCVRLW